MERFEREFQHLRLQAEALAPESAHMLDAIGVGSGWRCIDIGCGAGGVTDLLSEWVGATGSVLGLDNNRQSIEETRRWADGLGLGNTKFCVGDALAPTEKTGIASASFDLVHLRYVLTTIRSYDEVLAAAFDLVKPGGWLAIVESDSQSGLNCYPDNPAWARLKQVLQDVFDAVGADTRAGRKCWPLMRALDLRDLNFRPCKAGCRSQDALVDYLPQTILSSRPFILQQGLLKEHELDRLIGDCRAHLASPDTVSTSVTLMQFWGQRPDGPASGASALVRPANL